MKVYSFNWLSEVSHRIHSTAVYADFKMQMNAVSAINSARISYSGYRLALTHIGSHTDIHTAQVGIESCESVSVINDYTVAVSAVILILAIHESNLAARRRYVIPAVILQEFDGLINGKNSTVLPCDIAVINKDEFVRIRMKDHFAAVIINPYIVQCQSNIYTSSRL